MMVRKPPSLRVCPRLEIWDRAAQQPVVVVCFVERDKVLDGVDEVAEQRELLRRRRATVGTRIVIVEDSPELDVAVELRPPSFVVDAERPLFRRRRVHRAAIPEPRS